MNLSDLEYVCDCIANVSDIPIRLYASKQFDSAFRMHHLHPDPFQIYCNELLARKENISYFITPYLQFYGIVNHDCYTLILGPVGHCNLDKQEEHDYAFMLGITFEAFRTLLLDMNTIPTIPLENFLYILLMINFYLNGEKLDLSTLPLYDVFQNFYDKNLSKTKIELMLTEQCVESKPFHNTLEFEKQMLNYVMTGDTEGLSAFLKNKAHGGVGKVARHYLRQTKNIFITTVTLVSRAAVKGGLPEEEAMSLSDYYIQYAEELFDPQSISALQYHMVIDYTTQVNKTMDTSYVSPLIHDVIRYVKQNLSNNLDGELIAEKVHMSRSALCVRFKKEVGETLADFILKERIEKAKALLHFTNKPLSEISSFLCFSSQSHFQTAFKRVSGMTPKEYQRSFIP